MKHLNLDDLHDDAFIDSLFDAIDQRREGVLTYRSFAHFFFHHWDPAVGEGEGTESRRAAAAKRKAKDSVLFVEPRDALVAAAFALLRERILAHTDLSAQDTRFAAFKRFRALGAGRGLTVTMAQFFAALPKLAIYDDFVRPEIAMRLYALFDPQHCGEFSFARFRRVVFGNPADGSVAAPYAPVLPFGRVAERAQDHTRRTNRGGLFEGADELASSSAQGGGPGTAQCVKTRTTPRRGAFGGGGFRKTMQGYNSFEAASSSFAAGATTPSPSRGRSARGGASRGSPRGRNSGRKTKMAPHGAIERTDPWRRQRASTKFAEPKCGRATWLRYHFQREDLPAALDRKHGRFNAKRGLIWKGGIEAVDLHRWLPIFADGLREREWPFTFLAKRGLEELFAFYGKHDSVALIAAVPRLVPGVKACLATKVRAWLRVILSTRYGLVIASPASPRYCACSHTARRCAST